jgi:hypothetical protein
MRMYHHFLLVIIFSGLLAAGLLGSIFHWDFYKMQGENRKLTEFPVFSQVPVKMWPEQLEAWFNDHFGFRNTFIRRYNRLMREIGRDDRVIHGKNGWLYYNQDTIVKDFMGYRQADEEQLKTRIARLKSRRNWLENRGIEYLFVIIPNKSTVYPEFLPDNIASLRGKTCREQLCDYLKGKFDENVIDMTPSLVAAKENKQLYLKTDTHWNQYGAYCAYTNLINWAGSRLTALPAALSIEALQCTTKEFSGDLSRMTGTPGKYQEQTDSLTVPSQHLWEKSILSTPSLLTNENHPLDGNAPFTIHNPDGVYNAVIFHDSFMQTMTFLISANFKNTTFIGRYSNAETLKTVTELCSPDIVMEVVVERFLVEENRGALPDEIPPTAPEEL